MPLLPSPRHTAADLAAWVERERVDAVLAHTPVMDRRETRALETLARFADAGPCYVSVSWGKDSTCVAHLAWLLARSGGPVLPLAHGRTTVGVPDPEAGRVAEAFTAGWPGLPYTVHDIGPAGLPELRRAVGCGRYVSGVRAAESGRRRLSARTHGAATARTCRPLLRWSAAEVFAYLRRHRLPVHPAYGMSEGGARTRDLLRAHSLGSGLGAGSGSEEWERRYYPEVVGRAGEPKEPM